MNIPRLSFLAALAFALVGAGCGSIDVSKSGDPNRVLTGVVDSGGGLPAGAEIVVRLIAAAGSNDAIRPVASDLPVMNRPAGPSVDRVLGEHTQTLANGVSDPVPFRIEYVADDAVLRRGLNLDVRVSFGGKIRFRTVNAHVVTLGSSPFKQTVNVQAVGP